MDDQGTGYGEILKTTETHIGLEIRTMKKQQEPFDRQKCIMFAEQALSRPPVREFCDRSDPVGTRVVRFAIPLEMLKTQNSTRGNQVWSVAKNRKELHALMTAQLFNQRGCVGFSFQALKGRPLVRAIRFSSSQPDRGNNGFKMAIDRLGPDK